MPADVVYSPESEAQLFDLEEYLALRFYPKNAEMYIERIRKACRGLGLLPHRGKNRDDIAPGLRMIGFERRVAIYYRLIDDHVNIVGVHYGGHSSDIP
jgi:toxin ParE1/3/4